MCIRVSKWYKQLGLLLVAGCCWQSVLMVSIGDKLIQLPCLSTQIRMSKLVYAVVNMYGMTASSGYCIDKYSVLTSRLGYLAAFSFCRYIQLNSVCWIAENTLPLAP